MISQGIGRGNYSNLEPRGKIQISKVRPIKLSTTPFYLFVLSHLKVVEEVISLGWERHGGQIQIWEVTHFWESVFLNCGAIKILGRHAQAIRHPWISFLTHPHRVWLPHAAGRD